MLEKFLTKRRITAYSCALVILVSFFIYLDISQPNCANAQVCAPLNPEVVYSTGTVTGIPSSGCTTIAQSASFARAILSNSPRNYAVALRGWELRYTGGSGDDNWMNGEVRIQSVFGSGANMIFNVRVCLQDKSPSQSAVFQGWYTAFAWES